MNIILADDSALIRDGLAGLLTRRGHTILAQAASAHELVCLVDELCADEHVDLVITDVRMPPGMSDDGLRAAQEIRKAHPTIGLIVLSQYVSAAYASTLLSLTTPTGRAGVGYLLKDRVSRISDFIHAMDVIAAGGVVIDPEVTMALASSTSSGLSSLTERENEVLELMAQGLSNTDIARHLVVSAAAVSKHVSNIFSKLNLDPTQDNRRVRAILYYLAYAQPSGLSSTPRAGRA